MKVHVFSLDIKILVSAKRVRSRGIHFGKTKGDKVSVRCSNKLKILIEDPYVCQVKVHVFGFNMILL